MRVPVAAVSWAVLGGAGHPVPRASSIQAGQRAASWPGCPGSFQRKFNEISMLLLTGKQLCHFKAGRYHGFFFFLYFNLKFCFKQGESNVLSFSADHMVKSKPQRPKKCTGCEAEDPARIHKRSSSIFCSSKTKFSDCGLCWGRWQSRTQQFPGWVL